MTTTDVKPSARTKASSQTEKPGPMMRLLALLASGGFHSVSFQTRNGDNYVVNLTDAEFSDDGLSAIGVRITRGPTALLNRLHNERIETISIRQAPAKDGHLDLGGIWRTFEISAAAAEFESKERVFIVV